MMTARKVAEALQDALDAIQEADEICVRLSKKAFHLPADVHLLISNGLPPLEPKFHELWVTLDRLQLLAEKEAEIATEKQQEALFGGASDAPST